MVQASLLALGAKETAVSQLAEYSRALHRGLESFEKGVAIFPFPEPYVCHTALLNNVIP